MHKLVFVALIAWVGLCIGGALPGQGRPVVASYYHEPQPIACGGRGARFNPEAMTAAHKTLPCGTRLRVTYQGKSVEVVVNDRGPYVAGREIDLSLAAARALGIVKRGVATVELERL